MLLAKMSLAGMGVIMATEIAGLSPPGCVRPFLFSFKVNGLHESQCKRVDHVLMYVMDYLETLSD